MFRMNALARLSRSLWHSQGRALSSRALSSINKSMESKSRLLRRTKLSSPRSFSTSRRSFAQLSTQDLEEDDSDVEEEEMLEDAMARLASITKVELADVNDDDHKDLDEFLDREGFTVQRKGTILFLERKDQYGCSVCFSTSMVPDLNGPGGADQMEELMKQAESQVEDAVVEGDEEEMEFPDGFLSSCIDVHVPFSNSLLRAGGFINKGMFMVQFVRVVDNITEWDPMKGETGIYKTLETGGDLTDEQRKFRDAMSASTGMMGDSLEWSTWSGNAFNSQFEAVSFGDLSEDSRQGVYDFLNHVGCEPVVAAAIYSLIQRHNDDIFVSQMTKLKDFYTHFDPPSQGSDNEDK